MFITLYGINNIGKSTQAKMLVERLNKEGYKAKYFKYPIYDVKPTGPMLNQILRSGTQKISEEELQLWFVLNRYQFEPELKKILKKFIVVAEDYTGTALAWGSAKGAHPKWLVEINKHLLKEDLSILLKGERSLHAIEKNHIHENHDKNMNKVEKILNNLAKKNKWSVVKRQLKKLQTHERIFNIVKKHLS